jgi:purine-cytosine permease-like protein
MLTKRLIAKQYGIHFSDFAAIVVGALIIGKVVLIADHFKFVNRYPGKPLIYNVLWKTIVYLIAAFVVRAAEEVVPKLLQNSNGMATIHNIIDTIEWPHFWIIHLWLGILLFVYCSLRELIRAIGKDEVLRMFLGWQRKGASNV